MENELMRYMQSWGSLRREKSEKLMVRVANRMHDFIDFIPHRKKITEINWHQRMMALSLRRAK